MASTFIALPDEGNSPGVSSLNGLTGALALVAGTDITITLGLGTLTIASTSGNGNVTGLPPTDIRAIARWSDITGTTIENSPGTLIQDGGAIEASGFITQRSVTTLVTIPSGESWIAPELELEVTGSIEIEIDGELIII